MRQDDGACWPGSIKYCACKHLLRLMATHENFCELNACTSGTQKFLDTTGPIWHTIPFRPQPKIFWQLNGAIVKWWLSLVSCCSHLICPIKFLYYHLQRIRAITIITWKEAIKVNITRPFCFASTFLVAKLDPSRARWTWYIIGTTREDKSKTAMSIKLLCWIKGKYTWSSAYYHLWRRCKS